MKWFRFAPKVNRAYAYWIIIFLPANTNWGPTFFNVFNVFCCFARKLDWKFIPKKREKRKKKPLESQRKYRWLFCSSFTFVREALARRSYRGSGPIQTAKGRPPEYYPYLSGPIRTPSGVGTNLCAIRRIQKCVIRNMIKNGHCKITGLSVRFLRISVNTIRVLFNYLSINRIFIHPNRIINSYVVLLNQRAYYI